MKEAFGPKCNAVEIKIDNDRTLKCNVTYNADIAEEFYDVDFILEDKSSKKIKLGNCSFVDENWAKNVHLFTCADWLILPVKDYGYAKILLTNKFSDRRKDTIFSPHNLRYDSIWTKNYNEIPAWSYSGASKIDSIIGDDFYVTYEYRIGDNPPCKFYTQTVEYKLDTATAEITTTKVFERHEKNSNM